jgi:release factor glutamine methyltransferase
MPDIQVKFDATTTATKAWAELSRAFRAAGLESPVIDSRLLVCYALGLDRLALLRDPHHPVANNAAKLRDAAQRRLAHEPVSRIIGERHFWGRPFKITPDTLDPRPDSETLVAAALEIAEPILAVRGAAPLRLLDLGTGSGCLLLTLLAELPTATGVGVDISAGAVTVARENAVALGLADRAEFVTGSWADGLAGPFDIIVSNPPYIRSGDLAGLAPTVAAYDPVLALDGGDDGLAAYRQIIATSLKLTEPGAVVFEVGQGQAGDVQQLLAAALAGRPNLTAHRWRDLANIERVVGMAT